MADIPRMVPGTCSTCTSLGFNVLATVATGAAAAGRATGMGPTTASRISSTAGLRMSNSSSLVGIARRWASPFGWPHRPGDGICGSTRVAAVRQPRAGLIVVQMSLGPKGRPKPDYVLCGHSSQ